MNCQPKSMDLVDFWIPLASIPWNLTSSALGLGYHLQILDLMNDCISILAFAPVHFLFAVCPQEALSNHVLEAPGLHEWF
ncbi:hypothetical protein M0R45_000407 [Rubus argutus]|uniref:Uncharacterized protein n=1 Tax=Rubus argutus TaxID=59490 RepID=A0AAW1VLY5_RUBAR